MMAGDPPTGGAWAPARVLNDIALTLESVEDADGRVRHALELLQRLVRYDRCALLEVKDGQDRRIVLVPELLADEQRLMADTLDDLLALLSERHEHSPSQAQRSEGTASKPWPAHLAVPLVGLDQVIGVLYVGRDRDRYEEAELSLLSIVAAQLAAYLTTLGLYREKDEFIATLSHELRTPLTAVLGWATLLRSGSLGEAGRLRGVEAVARNATALARLTEDLLDLSRIATGKLRVELRPVEITRVVEASVEGVQPQASSRAIKLECEFEPVVGRVLGDVERLQQIVSNLLANSLKFTPGGGRITVRVEQVGSHVHIQVKDTGRGITPEFLPYVFDRSRQAASSSRRGHDGLGLGLGIVRSLVQLHGGHVRAESGGVGAGSTFTVILPLVPARTTQPPGASAPDVSPPRGTTALAGLRVAVVDSDDEAREVIRAILELHGAEVQLATSAKHALGMFEQSIPDVLLCDISMPDGEGPTILRQMTRRWPQIPVAVLTARATVAEHDRTVEAGFSVHLTKPVESEVLIRTVLDLSRKSGPAHQS